MLRVTPIYGASPSSPPSSAAGKNATAADDPHDDDPDEWLSSPVPSCTLVEYAGMKLLLNVGWDESLPTGGGTDDGRSVAPLDLPDDVDAVLVCDSTLASLGGLPRYFGADGRSPRGRSPRSLPLASAVAVAADQRGRDASTRRSSRNPPLLATYPTVKMGQMTLYDHHAALSLDGCPPGYALEDVDAVCGTDSFTTLKYSQTCYLPLDGEGDDGGDSSSHKKLAITPHLAGHVVGGCYWVLRQLSDDTEVVLAPTYHHAKERHLAGSTLHRLGANASALLTAPGGPRGLLGRLYRPPAEGRGKAVLAPPAAHRSEAALVDAVMAALRRDGNVLLPVDASGRVLELLLLLDRHWERHRLGGAYNLFWVGPMCRNALDFARSFLEWMAPPLGAQFDAQRGHPYALKAVTICASVDEMMALAERGGGNPSCVLASGGSLDHGPARDLLVRWGDNPDNLVMLTDSGACTPRGDAWFGRRGAGAGGEAPGQEEVPVPAPADAPADDEDGAAAALGPPLPPASASPATAAAQLLAAWCAARASRREMDDVVPVDVYVPRRAPLAGEELRAFLRGEEEERRARAAEAEQVRVAREVEIARGRLRLGDDEAGGATAGKGGGTVAAGASAAAAPRPKKKSRFDQNLFIKFSKPVHSA